MNEISNGLGPRRALHVQTWLAVALFGGFAIPLAACPGPTPQAGTGGSGGEDSSTSSTSSSQASSTSSSSSGMPCTLSQCDASTKQCMTSICEGTTCGFAPVAAMTPCTEDDGKLCDGAGRCVACVTTKNCEPPSAGGCVGKQCNAEAGLCEDVKLVQGSTCLLPARGICDEFGTCVSRKYVFVTSTAILANFGGTAKADAKCTQVAEAAGLGGTWKSWTSDSGSTPLMRFTKSTEPYMLLDDKTVVANNWAGLMSGTLLNGINIDEHKNPMSSLLQPPVWTGTKTDGGYAGSSCSNWMFSSVDNILTSGVIGIAGKTTSAWTTLEKTTCTIKARLYCFQQ